MPDCIQELRDLLQTAREHPQPYGPAYQRLVRAIRGRVAEAYGRESDPMAAAHALLDGDWVDKAKQLGGRATTPDHEKTAKFKEYEGQKLDEILAFIDELPESPRRRLNPFDPGRLNFREPLGAGGYGQVWLAIDGLLDRQVAVKLFEPDTAETATALDHARSLARVRNPHVVVVHEIGEARHPVDGSDCDAVVMEVVEGETLYKRLRGPLLGTEEATAVGAGLLRGLDAIHAAGLAHGDLHNENVMVGQSGHVTILDILYRGTLAMLPTTRREQQFRADLDSIHGLLCEILLHADLHPAALSAFREETRADRSLPVLGRAFSHVFRGTAGAAPREHDWTTAGTEAAEGRRYILTALLALYNDSPTAYGGFTGRADTPFSMNTLVREAEWLRHHGLIEAQIAGDGTRIDARILPRGRDTAEQLVVREDRPGRAPREYDKLRAGGDFVLRLRDPGGKLTVIAGTITSLDDETGLIRAPGGREEVFSSAEVVGVEPYSNQSPVLRIVQWARRGYEIHPACYRSWVGQFRRYGWPEPGA